MSTLQAIINRIAEITTIPRGAWVLGILWHDGSIESRINRGKGLSHTDVWGEESHDRHNLCWYYHTARGGYVKYWPLDAFQAAPKLITAAQRSAIEDYLRDQYAVRVHAWLNLLEDVDKPLPLRWDRKDGIGAVPNQQTADYFGWTTQMKPSEFLALAPPRDDDASRVLQAVQAGKALGPPFLEVSWRKETKVWRVVDHEGRGRCMAILQVYGDVPIPVDMFPKEGMRGRDVTPEMKDAPVLPQRWKHPPVEETTALYIGPFVKHGDVRLVGPVYHGSHRFAVGSQQSSEMDKRPVEEATRRNISYYNIGPVWRFDDKTQPTWFDAEEGGAIYFSVVPQPYFKKDGKPARRYFIAAHKIATPSIVQSLGLDELRNGDVSFLSMEEVEALKKLGYDSAAGPLGLGTGIDEYVVFSPEQVREVPLKETTTSAAAGSYEKPIGAAPYWKRRRRQRLRESADAKPFLRFYKAAERGLNPEYEDAWACLGQLHQYYFEYLEWYRVHFRKRLFDKDPKDKKIQIRIRDDFQKRFDEIEHALKSRDLPTMITAVDNGINQWHLDYPVVSHFAMSANDEGDAAGEEAEADWEAMSDILWKLGRMPHTSPYAQESAAIDTFLNERRIEPKQLFRMIMLDAKPAERMTGDKAWLTPDGKWLNSEEHRDLVPFTDDDDFDIGVEDMCRAGFIRVAWEGGATQLLHAEFAPETLTFAQRVELKNTAIERGGEVEYDPGQAWGN